MEITEINEILNPLTDIMSLYRSDVGIEIIAGQLAAIAVAVVIAFILSKMIGKALISASSRMNGATLTGKIVCFGLSLIRRVVFSMIAASILSLLVYFMRDMSLFSGKGTLAFVRLAYSVLWAWAILVVLLEVLIVLFKDKMFGPKARLTVEIIFWLLGALQIAGVLPEIVKIMQSFSLPIGSEKVTLWSLLVCLITVAVTLAVANRLADFSETAFMRMHEIDMNLRVVFARLARVGLMTIAVLVSLSSVGIDLTVLSVFGGALGVGIGFGMQKIASNYISGFIILFDRSVKLGDLVEVSGYSGVVTQINTRYSVIRNLAGEELIVPNETFVTNNVKNFNLSESGAVVTCDASCAYEADVPKALAVFKECVVAQPRVSKDKAPWVIVTSLADSGVMLRAGFWVDDLEKGTGGLKSEILGSVLKRFNEEGIEIPYNKLVVHLQSQAAE